LDYAQQLLALLNGIVVSVKDAYVDTKVLSRPFCGFCAAEAAYLLSYPTVGYSSDLGSLAGSNCTSQTSSAACIIDGTLAAATSSSTSKSGYYFTYTIHSTLGYTLLGTPAEQGVTGIKNFYSDSTGAIHYNSGSPAGASDPVIQ
jgi:hypothetical protein